MMKHCGRAVQQRWTILTTTEFVSDTAIFVLKENVKLPLTNDNRNTNNAHQLAHIIKKICQIDTSMPNPA